MHNLVVRDAATVLVTLRSGEPAPDAVTSLWKDEHLPRLELQALSAAETTALLEQVLEAPVDSTGADRLWSLSQGNLLFLRHLVDGELRSGRLRKVAGIWQWPETPELTPELSELVRNSMGELTETVRDVVDLLALGEPLGLDALGSLTERGAVEVAEQRGLVRIVHAPRLAARLAHPLYGEVRRAEIGQLRARRLRGLIATALSVKARRPSRSGVRCWPWNPISAPTQDRCSRQPTRPSGCSISPWGSGWPGRLPTLELDSMLG